MKIAGFTPNSFVDYPGNIAAVIFLPYCPLRCHYCHNIDIARGIFTKLNYDEVFAQIRKNKNFLDAVTITGGEPTLTDINELMNLIQSIKKLGLLVKIDTCGSNVEALKKLLPLVDYIAMDIKAPFEKYSLVTPVNKSLLENIKASVENVKKAKDYEFRTTLDPLLQIEDIEAIAQYIKGSNAYYIQQLVQTEFYHPKVHSPEYVLACVERANKYVQTYARGI